MCILRAGALWFCLRIFLIKQVSIVSHCAAAWSRSAWPVSATRSDLYWTQRNTAPWRWRARRLLWRSEKCRSWSCFGALFGPRFVLINYLRFIGRRCGSSGEGVMMWALREAVVSFGCAPVTVNRVLYFTLWREAAKCLQTKYQDSSKFSKTLSWI